MLNKRTGRIEELDRCDSVQNNPDLVFVPVSNQYTKYKGSEQPIFVFAVDPEPVETNFEDWADGLDDEPVSGYYWENNGHKDVL